MEQVSNISSRVGLQQHNENIFWKAKRMAYGPGKVDPECVMVKRSEYAHTNARLCVVTWPLN